MFPRVRIVNDDGRGMQTRIYIDDQDVSSCFSAVTVKAGVRTAVTAELEVVAAAVDFEGFEHLRFPNGETRELLIRHGWTPPASPAVVPSMRVTHARPKFEDDSLVAEFGEPQVPVSGRELVDRFIETLQSEWEPGADDSLTVSRVFDPDNNPIPGRRVYTLKVTVDRDE